MASHAVEQIPDPTNDTEQVRRALTRDASAFRAIMQTHNRCLYRIARSILRNNADAEDAVQQAYVSAFTNLANYRGEGSLKGWLSRIVINEFFGTHAPEAVNHRSYRVGAAAKRGADHSVSSVDTQR